ncbi:hypothetical protein BSY19_4814 (plasmid) [Bosea sp. RAC05]|nr:hypothetical protein BSY19_4814 [Bosea sp. RAC05]
MPKKHLDADHQRRHRTAVSKAMKDVVARSTCPSCSRKSALKREDWAGFVLLTCRWCKHEEGYDTLRRGG